MGPGPAQLPPDGQGVHLVGQQPDGFIPCPRCGNDLFGLLPIVKIPYKDEGDGVSTGLAMSNAHSYICLFPSCKALLTGLDVTNFIRKLGGHPPLDENGNPIVEEEEEKEKEKASAAPAANRPAEVDRKSDHG